jgi:hypothetical protein
MCVGFYTTHDIHGKYFNAPCLRCWVISPASYIRLIWVYVFVAFDLFDMTIS